MEFPLVSIIVAAICGLVLGSFFAGYAYRFGVRDQMPRRSFCPHCRHALAWFDLIPVVSFFALRGQCRYCRAKISWQYPAIEFGTAILFVFVVIFSPVHPVILARNAFAVSILWVLAIIDLKYGVLPDVITLPSIVVMVILNLFSVSPLSMLYGAALGGGFFLIQYLLSRGRAVGDGDIRLGILLGVLLGFQKTGVALLLAYVVGAIAALLLLGVKKTTLQSRMPMGPFLSFGGFVALLWGDQIISKFLISNF